MSVVCVVFTERETKMGKVYDYDYDGGEALCPFTGKACVMECMLMRPTGFGEPRCSMRVIADQLVGIDFEMREARKKEVSQ